MHGLYFLVSFINILEIHIAKVWVLFGFCHMQKVKVTRRGLYKNKTYRNSETLYKFKLNCLIGFIKAQKV